MNLECVLSQLRANRLVRNRDEACRFEQALEMLVGISDERVVSKLHLLFDDSCIHDEVVFSLVHLIESLDLELQLRSFANAFVQMYEQAPGWTRTLVMRLLNDETARRRLIDAIGRDERTRPSTERCLLDIMEQEAGEVAKQAQYLIDAVRGAE